MTISISGSLMMSLKSSVNRCSTPRASACSGLREHTRTTSMSTPRWRLKSSRWLRRMSKQPPPTVPVPTSPSLMVMSPPSKGEKLRPKHRAGLGWLCYGSEDTAGTPASRADAAHRPLGAGETTADHAKPAKARNMRRAVGLAAAGQAPVPNEPDRPEAARCRDDTGRRRFRGG